MTINLILARSTAVGRSVGLGSEWRERVRPMVREFAIKNSSRVGDGSAVWCGLTSFCVTTHEREDGNRLPWKKIVLLGILVVLPLFSPPPSYSAKAYPPTPPRPTRQLIAVVSNSQNGMNLFPRSGHFSHCPLSPSPSPSLSRSFLPLQTFSRCLPFVLIVITPSAAANRLCTRHHLKTHLVLPFCHGP